jgi:hypothetical protein
MMMMCCCDDDGNHDSTISPFDGAIKRKIAPRAGVVDEGISNNHTQVHNFVYNYYSLGQMCPRTIATLITKYHGL